MLKYFLGQSGLYGRELHVIAGWHIIADWTPVLDSKIDPPLYEAVAKDVHAEGIRGPAPEVVYQHFCRYPEAKGPDYRT